MNIYEIGNAYLNLYRMADDPDIDEEVIYDTLEALEGSLEDKADGYAKVIKQMQIDGDALKSEVDRLSARKKTIENRIKLLKNNLQEGMEKVGTLKIKTTLFNFSVQNTQPSLVIDVPEDKVPEHFLIPQQPKVDKTAIKNAIKLGEEIEFAHLEPNKSLYIR